jgi:hypothetical protein
MLLAVVVGRPVTELRPPTVMESEVAAERAPGEAGKGERTGCEEGVERAEGRVSAQLGWCTVGLCRID